MTDAIERTLWDSDYVIKLIKKTHEKNGSYDTLISCMSFVADVGAEINRLNLLKQERRRKNPGYLSIDDYVR